MRNLVCEILFAAMLLLGFAGIANAQSQPQQVPLEPEIIDGQGSDHGDDPRGPINLPTVYYEDYVLMFDSSCIGCTIELVQNDEVVFTGVVDTNGEVEIPDTLVGLVELRIRKNGITYIGEFEP